MKTGAIVLAGAPATPGMDPDGKLTSRAMVEVNGRTMLQHVVDALAGAQTIAQIVVVGNVEAQGVDTILEPFGSMVENINRAIPHIENGDQVLVVCADIPMLTSAAVDDFVNKAQDYDADLVYPIVDKASCQGIYADMKRTYVKTGDGCFTGGNITLVNRDFFSNNAEAIAEAYALRKKPFALAGLIGYGVLLKFIIAQIYPAILPLTVIEETASKLLGARLKALITEYPEIGQDVDKPEDVVMAEKILAARMSSLGAKL